MLKLQRILINPSEGKVARLSKTVVACGECDCCGAFEFHCAASDHTGCSDKRYGVTERAVGGKPEVAVRKVRISANVECGSWVAGSVTGELNVEAHAVRAPNPASRQPDFERAGAADTADRCNVGVVDFLTAYTHNIASASATSSHPLFHSVGVRAAVGTSILVQSSAKITHFSASDMENELHSRKREPVSRHQRWCVP